MHKQRGHACSARDFLRILIGPQKSRWMPAAWLKLEPDLFEDMLEHCLGEEIVALATELKSTANFRRMSERDFKTVDSRQPSWPPPARSSCDEFAI